MNNSKDKSVNRKLTRKEKEAVRMIVSEIEKFKSLVDNFVDKYESPLIPKFIMKEALKIAIDSYKKTAYLGLENELTQNDKKGA